MKKKKLIYVGFAFQHHLNTQAGYQHVKEHVQYDVIINAQSDFNFVFHSVDRLPEPIRRRYRRYFGFRLWFTELRCIIRAIFCKNQVFHIIYGENIYKYLGKFKGKTNKIVCTYHQPISVFNENKEWIESIKDLDKIILMGAEDHDFFRNINSSMDIRFIPHGINTDFYYPSTQAEGKRIMMVGNWLRDFNFANAVFKQLLTIDVELEIDVVTNKQNFDCFESNKRLHLSTNITDEELRNMYQKARIVFLPLTEFTANNALLEAAASGTDIIIATNIKSVSYFDENQISFVALEQDEAIKILLEKLENNFNRKNARGFVVDNYSWEVIGRKTEEYLLN